MVNSNGSNFLGGDVSCRGTDSYYSDPKEIGDETRYDFLTAAERSERMSRVRGKNTKPEMIVRRAVHRMGYRYRLHDPRLPGKPDLVFRSRKKVVFVNGCFWHLHDCGTFRMPKTRRDFWEAKLKSNRDRDGLVRTELERLGWNHLTIWECELADISEVCQRIRGFLC